jgi:hypothetical protein
MPGGSGVRTQAAARPGGHSGGSTPSGCVLSRDCGLRRGCGQPSDAVLRGRWVQGRFVSAWWPRRCVTPTRYPPSS